MQQQERAPHSCNRRSTSRPTAPAAQAQTQAARVCACPARWNSCARIRCDSRRRSTAARPGIALALRLPTRAHPQVRRPLRASLTISSRLRRTRTLIRTQADKGPSPRRTTWEAAKQHLLQPQTTSDSARTGCVSPRLPRTTPTAAPPRRSCTASQQKSAAYDRTRLRLSRLLRRSARSSIQRPRLPLHLLEQNKPPLLSHSRRAWTAGTTLARLLKRVRQNAQSPRVPALGFPDLPSVLALDLARAKSKRKRAR